MPTRCSMVAAADRRRRSSRSWRASSARFSARRSRTWGGTGKFSAHAPHPALSPEGARGLEAGLDLGLLAHLAHLVDPLSKVLAALFAPFGIEEVGRHGVHVVTEEFAHEVVLTRASRIARGAADDLGESSGRCRAC